MPQQRRIQAFNAASIKKYRKYRRRQRHNRFLRATVRATEMDFMSTVFSTTYESEEAATAACKAIGWEVGFGLARRNAWPPRSQGEPTYVMLVCSKAGSYRSRHNSSTHVTKARPNTSTQKTNCPFQLGLRRQPEGGWIVRPTSKAQPHNHTFAPAHVHSSFRAEVIARHKEQIITMYNNGVRPFHIAAQLRSRAAQEPELTGLVGKHIVNALAQHRREELAGRTPIQFLYDIIRDEALGFFFRDSRTPDGRLTALFIAPRSGVDLWRQYSHTLLLDCTYKTNRFMMPLLNFCGSTSERKTFSIAGAFMTGETEPNYRWALGCLLELATEAGAIPLPRIIVTDRELALMNALASTELAAVLQLLCRWHINKNVLAKTKSFFPKPSKEGSHIVRAPEFTAFLNEWTRLVSASEEEDFFMRLRAFKSAGHPQAAVDYAINTWIDPWKERFVSCFVDRHRHFGHRTTSIIEGMHSVMKRFLWCSTGDLTTVFQRLQAFWTHQNEEITSLQQSVGHKVATSTLHPVFAKIRPHLAGWALKQVGTEFRAISRNAATDDTTPPPGRCDFQYHCAFKASFGLPCRHDIFRRLRSNARFSIVPFELNEIDEFWIHNKEPSQPDDAPQEPLPVRSKGRPKGSSNLEKGTRREPSGFEEVEAIERAEATRPPPSTAPAALPDTNDNTHSRKRKADGTADGRGRARGRGMAAAANSTGWHQDSYEPGTAPPRSWQRVYESEYDELGGGAGNTQSSGCVHLTTTSQVVSQGGEIEDEDETWAGNDFNFDAMERQVKEDAQMQR